ncbi:hypothetical protein [Isoptericola sp. NPDC019482]|uniref:hypothetical protein n=1 Tax=Isoptericola sp. NPDC019482 TaxID=3154688 RepID=UPI003479D4E2
MTPGGRPAPPGGELAPLPASPSALVDVAEAASRTAERLADARTRLLRVRASLDVQRSTAVERASERVTTAADDARASGGMLEAAASTLRRHAVVLHDAHASAQRAIAERAEALGREARWQAEADEARRSTWNIVAAGAPGALDPDAGWSGSTAPGTGWSDGEWSDGKWSDGKWSDGGPAHAHLRLGIALRELAAARADAAAAESRWRAARDTKDEASRQAATALSALADVRAVRAIITAGADPARLQASGAAARAAVALLPRAATGAPSARHAVREDLRHVLTAHADDPAFWAVFWDSASPARLYDALAVRPPGQVSPVTGWLGDVLDPGIDDGLARVLGEGVHLWAQTASPQEQHDLGRRIVGDVAAGAASPFTPPGEAKIAAALLPATLPAAVHAGADEALADWWTERSVADTSFTFLTPVVVAVAGGLAAHPRLAFDRLAPADQHRTAAAASRWLGSAPHAGWPDGGRAVARAFGAAVDVGSTSADRGDQARAALLVSHATEALPDGLLLAPGLADEAARSVALAYEPYVPAMGDASRVQGVTTSCTGAEPPPDPGLDLDAEAAPGFDELFPLVVQPQLDAFALRDVIGATSRTPEAAAAWLGVTDRYAATTLEHATSDVVDADVSTGAPLVRAALSDIGAVAGGMQAETIEAAKAEVVTRETYVELAGAGVGYLKFGSKAVTEAVSLASGPALSFLDPEAPLHEARETVRADEDALVDRYAPVMYEALVENERDPGRSAGELERLVGELDPSENGSDPAATFDQTFDNQSDPEEPCS